MTDLLPQKSMVLIFTTKRACLPSSMAFLTARSPSLKASLICIRVCLFGPLTNKVTERGFTQSSIKVNFSSPYQGTRADIAVRFGIQLRVPSMRKILTRIPSKTHAHMHTHTYIYTHMHVQQI